MASRDNSLNNFFTVIISVDEDCEILVNGKKVGKTNSKQIKIEKLNSDKEYLIEGVSAGKYGKIKVKANEKLSNRHIILKPKPGNILTKSKIGAFEMSIEGKLYKCPSFIKNIGEGVYTVKIKYKSFSFDEEITVISGKTTEYELVNDILATKVREQRIAKLVAVMELPENSKEECEAKADNLANAINEFKDLNTESALKMYHSVLKKIERFKKEEKRKEISKKIEMEKLKKRVTPIVIGLIAVLLVIVLSVIGISKYNDFREEKRFVQALVNTNSLSDLNKYFAKYGKEGRFAAEIKEKMRLIKEDKKDFENAVKVNTVQGFESYLDKYKESAIYYKDAVDKLSQLKLMQTLPQVIDKYGLVKIPSGDYFMGSPRIVKEDLLNNTPQVYWNINSFYMGKNEVTFDEYDEYCKETGKPFPDDNKWGRGKMPVINVSWNDAKDYCKWLSEKTGFHFRLPSEPEWEYACRAGSTTKFYWGNKMSKKYCVNATTYRRYRKPRLVGGRKPNKFGLYDMAGNVYEWCEDSYELKFRIRGSSYKFPKLYDRNSSKNPVFTKWGDKRIIRGGDYRSSDFSCYSYQRNATDPESKLKSVGFRVVMDVPKF
jgi:formylglycine-generating enzyme required for sulfatase activity